MVGGEVWVDGEGAYPRTPKTTPSYCGPVGGGQFEYTWGVKLVLHQLTLLWQCPNLSHSLGDRAKWGLVGLGGAWGGMGDSVP